MSVAETKTNCARKFGNDHGRLFEPKSLAMYQSVFDAVHTFGNELSNELFIGVDDLNFEGNYVYSSNGEAIPFTIPWCTSSDYPRGWLEPWKDCIAICRAGRIGSIGWIDISCSHPNPISTRGGIDSICERV